MLLIGEDYDLAGRPLRAGIYQKTQGRLEIPPLITETKEPRAMSVSQSPATVQRLNHQIRMSDRTYKHNELVKASGFPYNKRRSGKIRRKELFFCFCVTKAELLVGLTYRFS